MVVRDELGEFKGAVCLPVLNASSAIQVEALALRTALELISKMGWLEVEIECDCAPLMVVVKGYGEDSSKIGRIVEDFT